MKVIKDELLIIGASGHGKVVADVAIKMNKWKNISFLDDDESIKKCMGLEVVGRIEDAYKYKDKADFFIAIGDNYIREKIQESFLEKELSIVKLIHPTAIIGTDVEIKNGTVVMAGVIINSSSRIGKGCIINTSSSIDHDNIINDYVHISPGSNLAGNVYIHKRVWLGIGSVISNNVEICSDCNFGAGSIVVKDIISSGTYIGFPVKKID